MADYIDGYLLVIPRAKLPAYKKLARGAGKIWKEHGALDYRECVSDELDVPFGRPYDKLLKCGPDEVIVFAWIVYKSKAARNRVNKLVQADERIAAMCDPGNMPFDTKKMSWGGFKTLVHV